MIRLRKLARAASLLTTPLAPEDILSLFNPVSSARQLRGVVTRVVPETADSATIFLSVVAERGRTLGGVTNR